MSVCPYSVSVVQPPHLGLIWCTLMDRWLHCSVNRTYHLGTAACRALQRHRSVRPLSAKPLRATALSPADHHQPVTSWAQHRSGGGMNAAGPADGKARGQDFSLNFYIFCCACFSSSIHNTFVSSRIINYVPSLCLYLSERTVSSGHWALCRLELLQKSPEALMWNSKLLLPHISHSIHDANVTLTRWRPRVTGGAGCCRTNFSVSQHLREQLSHTEMQPVDLQRVGTGFTDFQFIF